MDTLVLQRLAELPDGQAATLALVVGVEGSTYRGPGAMRIWTPDGASAGSVSGGCLEADLAERQLAETGRGALLTYDLRGGPTDLWGLGAGCNGKIDIWLQPVPPGPSPYRQAARWLSAGLPVEVTTLLDSGEQWAVALGPNGAAFGDPRAPAAGERRFVDRRHPAPLLLVYGTGGDAAVLVRMASEVGLRVRQLGRHDDVGSAAAEDPPASAVIMSHHFPGDRDALAALLAAGTAYIGVLGPRERTEQMLPQPWPLPVHAPVGLDVGAEGPEEIAVAILAEVISVLRGGSGGHLRDRGGPIHPHGRGSEARRTWG